MIPAEITPAELLAITSALPASARALVPVLGLARVLQVCRALGGQRVFIAGGPVSASAAASVLTQEERRAIIAVRGPGRHWEVPQLAAVHRMLRNASLLIDHEAGMTASDLADRYQLCARHVRKIISVG